MRILKVIDTLSVGGAEKVFVDLTNLLFEAGVQVSTLFILTPGVLANQLHPNIPRYQLNRTSKWSPITMYRCASILKKFDIIHCHHRYIYAYVNFCALLFGVKPKIILHDHYGLIDINKKVPRNISGLFKPDYFIGVSSKLTHWAIQELDVNPTHVYLLSNIVRSVRVGQHQTAQYDWVLVSNIKPIKNQLFAVELAKKMGKSLLIIGNVQNQEYFQDLKAASADARHPIFIQTGIEDVRPLLTQAKMGLHVSKSETGPLALIEYLSVGLPFVAYQTGEVAKTLSALFPEMIVPNFDTTTWIESIHNLERIATKQYSQSIIRFYEANFGEKQYLQTCLSIYQTIMADS